MCPSVRTHLQERAKLCTETHKSHLLFAAAASGCADNLTQRSETRLSPTAYLFSDQLDTQRKASFASCFLAAELFWEGFCILLSCSSTININLSEINRAGWGCRDANSLCNTTLIQFRCCWESLCVSSLSFNPRSASVWNTVFSRLVWGQLLSPPLPVCFLFQIQEEKSADVSVFLCRPSTSHPRFHFHFHLSFWKDGNQLNRHLKMHSYARYHRPLCPLTKQTKHYVPLITGQGSCRWDGSSHMKFRRVPLNRRPFVTLRVCGTFSVQLQSAVSDTWSSISRRKMEEKERETFTSTHPTWLTVLNQRWTVYWCVVCNVMMSCTRSCLVWADLNTVCLLCIFLNPSAIIRLWIKPPGFWCGPLISRPRLLLLHLNNLYLYLYLYSDWSGLSRSCQSKPEIGTSWWEEV